MNTTLKIATLYECNNLDKYSGKIVNAFDPMWKQTVAACMILDVLQYMYRFNVTYILENRDTNVTVVGEADNITFIHYNKIDVFARCMSLRLEIINYTHPVLAVNNWRFGFLVRQPDVKFFSTFYSKPFTRPVWNCLYAIAFFVSIFFYILKKWEVGIAGGWETSYSYETLMVIGAYCQHIPPIDPKLPSRRIAYVCFFCFAYMVYTFYTSNLLSNLVNDKDLGLSLETLAQSHYEFAIVDYMKLAASKSFRNNNRNYSLIVEKLRHLRAMSVADGVESLRTGKVALLSDYTTIYPYIRETFTNEEICKLKSVDLFSSIKKYFFTSKNFRFKEEFKIGTLRIKETGILKRLVSSNFDIPQCAQTTVETNFIQISVPVTILLVTYFVSVLILVVERIHYDRNTKVFPYVE